MFNISKKTTRISITIPESTRDAIASLAEAKGTSVSETVNNLIATGMSVEAVVQMDGEVIARKNGKEWSLANREGRWLSSSTGTMMLNGP